MPQVMAGEEPGLRAQAIAAARHELCHGRPVVIPTDTVYGLAAKAAEPGAVGQLFELKERPAERSIAVLVADLSDAEALVQFGPMAGKLAECFWPGPLTIVATRQPGALPHLGDASTIGVRLPDDDLVRALAVDGPLAVTSANRHGAPTPATAQEVAELFPTVRVVVDGGHRPGASSTVVDTTGAVPVVLRSGPVTLEMMREKL